MGGIEALTDRTAQRNATEMHRNPSEPQAETSANIFVCWIALRPRWWPYFFETSLRRKLNFTNSKTLASRCRDRPSRALPLTCPNVNHEENFLK